MTDSLTGTPAAPIPGSEAQVNVVAAQPVTDPNAVIAQVAQQHNMPAPVVNPLNQTQTPASPAQAPVLAPKLDWIPNADEETVGYIQNKGWTNPEQVLRSYQGLEKLLGADKANNAVIVPKPDADADTLNAFYSRLGRPADPSGYRLPVPPGQSDEFAKAASQWMFENGLSEKQGQALAAKWNEFATQQQAAKIMEQQQRLAQEDAQIKAEWGQAYTQNLNQAQAAVRGLGIKPEQIDALASSIGHKATMELFQKIGSQMNEAQFIHGGKQEGFGQALTPAQARAQIAELRQDKGFVAKLMNKDAEANNRWQKLHEYAYPSQQ